MITKRKKGEKQQTISFSVLNGFNVYLQADFPVVPQITGFFPLKKSWHH
jgi:hypothetical protein